MEIPNSFINVTEAVGKDINLVQGPGGNISYKKNGMMYIKASGTKMCDARKKNIFVKTDHKKILKAIENNEIDPIKNNWQENGHMKPSIETSMHALIPHKYVLHVHCVNALSWIVQKNYQKKFNLLLKGFNWKSVSYKKPGISLCNEIKKAISNSNTDIIFLSNHGVVAGADSPKKVFNLIKDISEKLYLTELNKQVNLDKIYKFLDCKEFKLPKHSYIHKIAFSKYHYSIMTKGDLFPDQTIFLEKGIFIVDSLEEIHKIVNSNINQLPVVLIPNVGIIVPKNFKEVNEDILLGLSMIVSRIPKNTSINYLSNNEKKDLINWDLEKFRKKLNN